MDFDELKSVVGPVVALLDHGLLNEIPGLENPTAELLAKWLWARIKTGLPGLQKVELKETPTSGVLYTGD